MNSFRTGGLTLAVLVLGLPLLAVLTGTVPLYARWLRRHPAFGVILATLLSILAGLVGRDLGLNDLYWHADPWAQFGAGLSVMAVTLVMFFLGFLLDEQAGLAAQSMRALHAPRGALDRLRRRAQSAPAGPGDAAGQLRVYLEVMSLPVVLLLTVLAVWQDRTAVAEGRPGASVWMLPLGAAATLLGVSLILRVVSVARWRRWHGWTAVLVPVVVVNGLYALSGWWPKLEEGITAAMAISLLLVLVAWARFATYGRPRLRLGLVAGLMLAMAYTNSDSYKLTYPGLEDYRGSRAAAIRLERPPFDPQEGTPATWRIQSAGEKAYRTGVRLLNNYRDKSRYETSIRHFNDALLSDPEYIPALSSRALAWFFIYLDNRETNQAMATRAITSALRDYDVLDKLIVHRGILTPSYVLERARAFEARARLQGDCVQAEADYEASIKYYREVISADSRIVAVRADLAALLDKYAEKLDGCNKHEEADVKRKEASAELFEAARLMQRNAAAAPLMRDVATALDLPAILATRFPDPVGAHSRLGIELTRAGQWEAAILAFAQALKALRPRALQLSWPVVTSSGLLNDSVVLERWRLARAGPEPVRGQVQKPGPNPKLAVVCVSGGGIVAAGWTVRCLTAIEERYPDFPYHVRVITGASGGMVGAGLYVASLPAPLPGSSDESTRQAYKKEAETRHDLLRQAVDRDSLTPVVRQMVLRDLPSIFCPWPQRQDRGRVLDRTWEEHSHQEPPKTFYDLAIGEAEGWRPSLIVSPLLVEDGAQMVISNLDLEGLPYINMHFFSMFPQARAKLKLSTALRMNAAFPLVTPAVSLPTDPPRRVADAGYVDNYGVRLATDWLRKNRDFLSSHTSGVALVQIRAYPRGLPEELDRTVSDERLPLATQTHPPREQGFLERLGAGLRWLTTPLEGYTAAKKTAMVTLNDNLVAELKQAFSKARDYDPNFFKTFILESTEEVPLSWSLTPQGQERLDHAVQSEGVTSEIKRLVDFLGEPVPEPPSPPLEAPTEPVGREQ